MKILFSVLMILLTCETILPRRFFAAQTVPVKQPSLILEGEVKKLEKDKEDAHFFEMKATLLLTFRNIGREPIIIYQRDLWLGAKDLSRTIEDAGSHKFIFRSSAWPSTWLEEGRKLRKILNQPDPPPDFTLILQPGESWQLEKTTHLGIDKKGGPSAHGLLWDEMKDLSPVWLLVTFEMWPVNVEPRYDDKSFGEMLRKRWRRSGELWLDQLTSQPIALDFNTMKVTQ